MSATLAQLARRPAAERAAAAERCELCGAAIGSEHRHLLERATRELACACRSCALLFDRREIEAGRYLAVPERRLALPDLELDDRTWEELRLPVDIAFVLRTLGDPGVRAFYPGPMGATESLLRLEAWAALEAANPVLRGLEPEVEALLVDRARGRRRQWLVPIDECFSLVGLIRTRWRGLTGGREVWEALDRFFDGLDARSRRASRNDHQEATWPR